MRLSDDEYFETTKNEMMDSLLDQLCEEDASGEPLTSYGRTLPVTEKQSQILVTMAHMIPGKLTLALELLECSLCTPYTSGTRLIWAIESYPVCLRSWTCPCENFKKQKPGVPGLNLKWCRVCEHLIAAHFIDRKVPFVQLPKPIELDPEQLAVLALFGPSHPSIYGRDREHEPKSSTT